MVNNLLNLIGQQSEQRLYIRVNTQEDGHRGHPGAAQFMFDELNPMRGIG